MNQAIQRNRQFDFALFAIALVIVVGLTATWYIDVRDYVNSNTVQTDEVQLWTADTTWTGGWQ